MKPLAAVLTCAIVLCSPQANSQTERGSWELSLSGNAGSTATSYEYSFAGQTQTGEGEARGYAGLDFRFGYYIVDGFSLEPEFYWLAAEKDPPTFNVGGNAAYTFSIPESPVRPYVTAGYGIGNGVPLMQRLVGRSSDELDIPVLRVGGGLKVLISKNVALKLEYRYERYAREDSGSMFYYSYTSKQVQHFHNLLIGFSVFLPRGE